VLNHEWNNKLKTQSFYVKWKGYPDSDNSWVKQEDFDDVAVIKRYWKSVNTKTKEQKGPKTKASSTFYKKRNAGRR
jgi:chromobox protein 5